MKDNKYILDYISVNGILYTLNCLEIEDLNDEKTKELFLKAKIAVSDLMMHLKKKENI
jgi:hypothetical protein